MAMEKLAVSGGSSISARQWVDFWEKVELSKINSRNFQDFLDNPEKFSSTTEVGLISLTLAKKILGRRKIFTTANYNKIWHGEFSDWPIFYTEKDLREADLRNQRGDDWRLVFYGGLPITHLRHKFGIDLASQPCFHCGDTDWYWRNAEKKWSLGLVGKGYYLVNFRGQFKSMNHSHQEKHLEDPYFQLERTDPHVFTEALFSLYFFNKERLANNWRHWSSVKTSGGLFVHVGSFDFNGFRVGCEFPTVGSDDLRVSVCAKPRKATS
jgi:hypothetical protein